MELNLIKGKYERPAVAVREGLQKKLLQQNSRIFVQCSGRVAETIGSLIVEIQILLQGSK
jgi:hypothetical protein